MDFRIKDLMTFSVEGVAATRVSVCAYPSYACCHTHPSSSLDLVSDFEMGLGRNL